MDIWLNIGGKKYKGNAFYLSNGITFWLHDADISVQLGQIFWMRRSRRIGVKCRPHITTKVFIIHRRVHITVITHTNRYNVPFN